MGTEQLDGGTVVYTAPGAGFGSDALLLARFARPRPADRALDLCSGCGIVALVWHDEGHRGPCTALELDPDASALCARAGVEHIQAVCGDVRTFCRTGAEQARYDFAACNPPYFSGGPASPDPRRAAARHTGSCTLADVAACAGRALRDGGKLVLCHRPDQMAEVFCTLRAYHLEPKRAAMVKNRPDGVPWLFLVEAQKNRRPGLRWESDILPDAGLTRYGMT